MQSWNRSIKSYKGRVVLRSDIVKDDSGSRAVFTEQGSSTSLMTVAKVMDVIVRLPDCAGQAADAISAFTLVNMEDAPGSLKLPKSECPDFWSRRLPRHKWPTSRPNIEDPIVSLERNLCGHSRARLLSHLGIKMGKSTQLGMSLCTSWKRIILICVRESHTKVGTKQKPQSYVKEPDEIGWSKRTVIISWSWKLAGCTQRECKSNESVLVSFKKMLESRTSAEATEKYLGGRNLTKKMSRGSISTFSCGHFIPINNTRTMSKKLMQQELSGEAERVVAKSKPMMSLVSKTADQSPIAWGLSASYSPWTLKAQSSETRGGNDKEPIGKTYLTTILRISRHNVGHLESLLERTTESWSSTGRRYAWHRRQHDCLENIRPRQWKRRYILDKIIWESAYCQEHRLRESQAIVRYVEELTLDQIGEIFGISTSDWNIIQRMRTTLLHARAVELSKAKVHFLTLNIVNWIVLTENQSISSGNVPNTHNTAIAWWDPKDDGRAQDPTWTVQRSKHLHVDITRHRLEKWSKQTHVHLEFFRNLRRTSEDFLKDVGHSSDRDRKKNGTECTSTNLTVRGTMLRIWWWFFTESGHPICRWTSELSQGLLRSRRGEKLSIHYNDDSATAELFRTFQSFSSVSTEQFWIGAKNLLSRSHISLLPVQRDPLRWWKTNRSPEYRPMLCQS